MLIPSGKLVPGGMSFFGTFQGEDARPWILAVVRNACYRLFERERPGGTLPFDLGPELSAAVADLARRGGGRTRLVQQRRAGCCGDGGDESSARRRRLAH